MNRGKQVFLHTGSNLGNKAENLRRANELIGSRIGPIERYSRVYHTEAWGNKNQPDFLNQALSVSTTLQPADLLKAIQEIERIMGRTREIKWGERLIDIDILFYEDRIIDTQDLTIPHPYLHYRNFVLVPLLDIAPDFVHPVLGRSIAQLHANTDDLLVVQAVDRK